MTETPTNGLTVKVAVGVFLGVMAALILYHIPGWYKKREAENAQEKQEEIDSRLFEMKPMDFIARCGSLVEDKTSDLGGGMASRDVTVEVEMPDGSKKKVTADWTLTAGEAYDPRNWLLESVDGLDATSDTWKPVIEGNYPCTVKTPAEGYSDPSLLTPNQVISECGKPAEDKSEDDGRMVTRYMTFDTTAADGSRKKVTAVFSGFGNPDAAPDLTLDYFGGLSAESNSAAVIEKWYPCLNPSSRQAP